MMHLLNMKHISLLLATVALLLGTTSCFKHEDPDPSGEITFTYGAYFLNAGVSGVSEITQLDNLLAMVTPHCYASANDGKQLGNGACDIHIFGTKMYVTLAGSKRIKVVGPNNCKDLDSFTISADDGTSLTPAYMADFEGMLLVSLKEGYVASVDTVDYTVRNLQKLDASAGCLAIADQKLYVACPDAILMMNPVDLHVMKTLDVEQPRSFAVASDNHLYLVAGQDETSLLQVNSDNEAITRITTTGQPQKVAAGPDKALIVLVKVTSDEVGDKFLVVNIENLSVDGEFIRDGSYVKDPTGLFIDPNTGNVYVSQDGESGGDYGLIYIYTGYGQYLTSFNTGTARTVGAAFVTGSTGK